MKQKWDRWSWVVNEAERISLDEAMQKLEQERGKWDLLFVYGTLKRGYTNHRLMLNSFFIDEAITKNRYWRTGFISTYDVPVKNVKPKRVEGELYLVPVSDLTTSIDALEGHPHVYTRKKVPVILKHYKKELHAWLYFLNRVR